MIKHEISHSLPIKQSGIRAATIRCEQLGGINLGQGVCDLETPEIVKYSAMKAICADKNTYAAFEGVAELRDVIANKFVQFNKINLSNYDEVIITMGSTGAFVSAIRAITQPGDEIILIEPFYGYHKQILDLHGIGTKGIKISLSDLTLDFAQLKLAVTSKTKAIVLCNPANPSGKVYTKSELTLLGKFAQENNLYIITDEIYEYIVYPEHEHISIASLDAFHERTITISGLSKTYNITGWRLGYACGPKAIIEKMSLIHDLLYICPPTPLQYAAMAAFNLPENYYIDLKNTYLEKREITLDYLYRMELNPTIPQGAYYILVDFSAHTKLANYNDEEIGKLFLEKAQVAVVTGRSFYHELKDGISKFRICYALNEQKVVKGLTQLEKYIKSL